MCTVRHRVTRLPRFCAYACPGQHRQGFCRGRYVPTYATRARRMATTTATNDRVFSWEEWEITEKHVSLFGQTNVLTDPGKSNPSRTKSGFYPLRIEPYVFRRVFRTTRDHTKQYESLFGSSSSNVQFQSASGRRERYSHNPHPFFFSFVDSSMSYFGSYRTLLRVPHGPNADLASARYKPTNPKHPRGVS